MSCEGKQVNRCRRCGAPLPGRFSLCEDCVIEESHRNDLTRKTGLDWLFSYLAEEQERKNKWIFDEIEEFGASCTLETVLAFMIVCGILVLVFFASVLL